MFASDSESRNIAISLDIEKFYESEINGVIYYTITITKEISKKTYTIDKRFSDFVRLNFQLAEVYRDLPILPARTLKPPKDIETLQIRRQILQDYLRSLFRRTEVISSEAFKIFLNMDSIAPEFVINYPKLIRDMDWMTDGTRDFDISLTKGMLLTLTSTMNPIARLDKYIENMKLPWSQDNPNYMPRPVGYFEVWKLVDWSTMDFDIVWSKPFRSQIICLHWNQNIGLAFLGLDDGSVVLFSKLTSVKSEEYEESLNNKLHDKRVMGIFFETSNNNFYSIGKDRKLVSYSLTRHTVLSNLVIGTSPLTCLQGDKNYKRLFITNKSGSIYVIDISAENPVKIHEIGNAGTILRGLAVDIKNSYLFSVCYKSGRLSVCSIGDPGKESFTKIQGTFQSCITVGKFLNVTYLSYFSPAKARVIEWNRTRNELYVGDEYGCIQIWRADKAVLIYIIKAHSKAVTSIKCVEKENIIVSSSKEKHIKFWRLPPMWIDPKDEKKHEIDIFHLKKTKQIVELKRKLQRIENDSDEDDLNDWHKNI